MTVIYGIILSGGQGKRMGYIDKGLIRIGDDFLVQHVIKALSQQVDQIIISANQNVKQYREFGYKVVKDDLDGFAGPLAGLCRALNEIAALDDKPALIMTVPCDAPLLPRDLLDRMLREYQTDDTLAVIPHDGIYLQPLFGLYSTKLIGSLEDYLASGRRKVTTWVESLNPRIVDFSDEADMFMNINSEEDLLLARKVLSH